MSNPQNCIELLKAKNINASSAIEGTSLFLHALHVKEGFIGVVEQASNVPGFAPSIRGKEVNRGFCPGRYKLNNTVSLIRKSCGNFRGTRLEY